VFVGGLAAPTVGVQESTEGVAKILEGVKGDYPIGWRWPRSTTVSTGCARAQAAVRQEEHGENANQQSGNKPRARARRPEGLARRSGDKPSPTNGGREDRGLNGGPVTGVGDEKGDFEQENPRPGRNLIPPPRPIRWADTDAATSSIPNIQKLMQARSKFK